ncbi:hypothetical protein [Desulfotomaculum defluvii]
MAKKAKRPSLKKQAIDEMYKQQRFGHSKHQAKQVVKSQTQSTSETYNPSRALGIYSISTMQTYRKECIAWAKQFEVSG